SSLCLGVSVVSPSGSARGVLVGALRGEALDPDVAVPDRVAVVLEDDGTGLTEIGVRPAFDSGGTLDLDVVLDQDAVLEDGDARLPRSRARGVEAGGAEDDVERLPLEGRLAGVHQRRRLAIDGAAVALAGELPAVGVEHLDLVARLEADAAVPFSLPARV